MNTSVACAKIPSVLLGRKVMKYYRINTDENLIRRGYCYSEPELEETSETIERVKIGEYDLPPLKEKDEIYLSDYDVYTTIQKVTIGTDGKVYYNVSYVTEYVDELEKSKAELQPELNRLKALYEEKKKKIEEEKEIKNKKLEELNDELEKLESEVMQIKEWQEKNPNKIKGIIICEVPKNKDGEWAMSPKQWEIYMYRVILSIPKEYIVITSFDKVTYIDRTNKKFKVINK